MLSTGPLNTHTHTTVHSSDGHYGAGYTLNSLHFLPQQPNIPWLQTHLPVQFIVSPQGQGQGQGQRAGHENDPETPTHLTARNVDANSFRSPMTLENRRSSTGNASRRGSTGTVPPMKRSVSDKHMDTVMIDHPANAAIRLMWKKGLRLNTTQLRPALAIRITSINVVDKSHFEYKIWVNDIDSGNNNFLLHQPQSNYNNILL